MPTLAVGMPDAVIQHAHGKHGHGTDQLSIDRTRTLRREGNTP